MRRNEEGTRLNFRPYKYTILVLCSALGALFIHSLNVYRKSWYWLISTLVTFESWTTRVERDFKYDFIKKLFTVVKNHVKYWDFLLQIRAAPGGDIFAEIKKCRRVKLRNKTFYYLYFGFFNFRKNFIRHLYLSAFIIFGKIIPARSTLMVIQKCMYSAKITRQYKFW